MDIVIIGAGIVGLTSAWYLQNAGHRVTVVDRHPAVGMGTSQANGGQLSYRYIAPLADPDVLSKIPGWMLRRDAPVRFRPRFDPEQWSWLLNFLKACNGHDKLRSVASLLPLSLYSQSLIHELVDDHAIAFDFVKNGKLIIHRDMRDFEAARRLVESRPELAEQQSALDETACLALEPALARLRGRIHGGIYTPSEDAGDCQAMCQALALKMREAPNPVNFILDRSITGLATEGRRIVAVHTREGHLPTDAVVVAAGVAARALVEPLGISLPLYPIKGYSINLELTPGSASPAVSITDYKRKIVYARIGRHLRVAGMADIVGTDDNIVPDRIQTLVDETRECFGDWVDTAPITPWAGLRPATPTGRPIIDQAPGYDNLWLNVGQGALGFTLSAGCARLLADRIEGRQPAVPHHDFLLEAASPRGWRPG